MSTYLGKCPKRIIPFYLKIYTIYHNVLDVIRKVIFTPFLGLLQGLKVTEKTLKNLDFCLRLKVMFDNVYREIAFACL